MTTAAMSEQPGFVVEETADTLLITFPNNPRILITTLIAELIVLWTGYLVVILLWAWFMGGFTVVCEGALALLGFLQSLVLILWNYFAVDRIKVDSQRIELERTLSFLRPRQRHRFRPEEIKKLRPVNPSERVTALQRIFGFRLIFLPNGGALAIETSQGMTFYMGWRVTRPEVEQVIALIQQRFPQYGQLA
jgi:hypothetical protein